jgi:hypothetical protein
MLPSALQMRGKDSKHGALLKFEKVNKESLPDRKAFHAY